MTPASVPIHPRDREDYHLEDYHRMGRNYVAHSSGDALNAVLAAVGHNFRRLIQ
jgi:hypothetical protein